MEIEMDIDSKKGTKVKATSKSIENGYPHVKEHAKKYLEIGKEYTVEQTFIGDWNTLVYLKEFPTEKFNSVTFVNC